MTKLSKILHDLDQGNITAGDAQAEIMRLQAEQPTIKDKNKLPLAVKYAYNEAIEMYQNIIAYEMGLIDELDFINHTLAIKDKYLNK